MADTDFKEKKQSRMSWENDPLDRELDAALAKYADVAPRAGLEKRVLANLRTKHDMTVQRAWWYLPAALVVVALIVFVISQERRAVQPDRAAYHPSTALPPHTQPALPDV